MAEKVGEVFVEIRADLSKLKADMAMMKGTVTKTTTAMADKFRNAGRAMTIAGAAITAAFGYAVKGSMDLEAKLKRVEIQSGATAKEMAEIKKVALSKEMVKLGKSGAQVADVFNRLASEGYNVVAMRKMLNPILQTAIVLGTNENETTKLMLNLMQQYNLEASDMAYISDVLAGALANTSFQGQELVDTMKYAGVAASQLGWSLEGTIPIIDAVIKVTGEASMAGTQFRMMVMKLRDPTAEMEKEFAKVGITLNQVAEAIKTPIGLINLLNEAHEKGANFASMFGARAASAAAVIARQSVPAVEALTKKVSEQGFAQKAVGEIMDTTTGKFATMGAAMQNIRTTIGDVLLPVMAQLAEWISVLAIKFKEWAEENKPLVDILVKVGAGIGALAVVGGPILMLISVLIKLAPAIMAVKTALLTLASGGIYGLILAAVSSFVIAYKTNLFGMKTATDKVIAGMVAAWDWYIEKTNILRAKIEAAFLSPEDLKEASQKTINAFMEFTKEIGSVGDQIVKKLGGTVEELKKTLDLSEILKPAEEAIKKLIEGYTEYEKQLVTINEKYDEAIEKIKTIIKEEDELKIAIDKLNAGREAEITLLDRAVEATKKLNEAKKKLTELTKSLTDKIYEFTHTEYEIKLRDINREYDLLVENAKEVFTTQKELTEAMKIINEERQEAIDLLKEENKATDETIEANKELKESIEEVAEVTKEAAVAAENVGVLGGKGWDNLTSSIKRATVSLTNFTKEGLAAAIATVKMSFFPLIQELQNTIATSTGWFKAIAEANLAALKQTMKEQIDTLLYGLQVYNDVLAQMNTGGGFGGGGFGMPSYQTGTPYVPKTGLALLHQGEAVIPANQNTNNNSFSPTVNLTVQGGGDSKNIAQEVESVLYDMGRQFKRRGFEMIPGRG